MDRPVKHVVEFPNEGCINVSEGQSLLEATLLAGIPLFHVCGGQARCSTCRVLVLEGEEWLSPQTSKERLLQEQMQFPPHVRLACQTLVKGGPVRVRRIIMDENDIGMYVRPSLGTTQHLGEEQELVLFFLDIRDFTPFVETHLAFDIIHIIRKLFYVIQDVLYNNGGQIIETAGDGVYAVFGCENNRVKSVQSAVQSGLSILATIETLNATYFSTHFSTRIQIGIGIHIGSVISGTIRVGNIDHKVVMGFPVNVAARLQSATKELNNTLIVSSDIYEILPRTTFDLTPSSIVVKGVSTVLTVYLLGQPYR